LASTSTRSACRSRPTTKPPSNYSDGSGCDTITGKFKITKLTWLPNTGSLDTLSVSFEEHCNGKTPALYGCIHYQKPKSSS
jgi:hypothetical protein